MTDENYLKKLADMQTQIKELVPDSLKEDGKRNWIPVEERLPDEDGRYLVCLDTGIVDLLKFALDLERVSNNFGEDFVDDFDDYPEIDIDIDAAKNRHRPGWYAYNYDSGLYEIGNPYDKLEPHVIAWMPLPKPYRRYDA